MSAVDKIFEGLQAIAPTAANLVIPGTGPLVETLMRAVTGKPQKTPIGEVAEIIDANPQLLMELHSRVLTHELQLKAVEAKNLATVNATMQAESRSERWPQYSWRPFNGFTFPLAVLLIYFVLPMAGRLVPEVPQWVWVGWLSILGVATWDRGKEKLVKAGDRPVGMLTGVIEAIRK